jgi:hypothetical protein
VINTDILYLRKFYDKTYIKKIDSNEFIINQDICELFDNYLLNQLTTLNGRLDAIKKVYHINKNIPVFLDNNLVFIQTFNKKQHENIYINVHRIIDMIKDKENTIIIFEDESKLLVEKPLHIIKKYYNNSLKINLFKFRKGYENGKEKY